MTAGGSFTGGSSRIIGLDFGERTVGVAVSDAMLWTAQGVCVIRRKDEKSLKGTIEELAGYISQYNADTIVLGFPKNMNNTSGERCEKTLVFQKMLVKRFPNIKIELFDERLTTAAAERLLLEADLSRRKRRDVIDKMAAVQILQGYLDCIAANQKKAKNKFELKTIHVKLKGENKLSNIEDDFNENDNIDMNTETDLDIDASIYEDDALETLTMTDDEGNDIEFVIIDEIKENGITYLLLVENEYIEDEESEAAIFKEIPQDGEDSIFEEVDDDEEFSRIAKLFSKNEGDYEIEF